MPVDRPTFIESWYRVSDLTPRLLGAVKVRRQHFRGLRWYIVQNPASNEYFRVSAPAYHFAAMLDGRRTGNEIWRVCMERYGDASPTQGEVVDLLSRLYMANLLQGDVAPDAEELFQRYQNRKWREVRGLLTNFLFVRVPLWDPDRFLDRWVGIIGKWFTPYGWLVWSAIVLAGLWAIGGHVGDLTRQASGVLNPENLPLLYLSLILIKLCHEMGHAFSCKYFGKLDGSGGEVHQMGVMFLVFAPLPFVDASSAWALRNKRQRIIVGASGMLVELAIAALAAIFWVHTAEGTTVHAIAYNIMFIASVSTVLFNGNPLLRYDAYYILLDAIEVPNLDSRSRTYIAYLVKRYLWGVRNAHDPSYGPEERGWLAFYAVASVICRTIVFAAIILFVGGRFFSMEAKRDQLNAELRELKVQRRYARTTEAAAVQIMSEKVAALQEQITRNDQKLKDLHLRSPIPGVWVAPESDRLPGRYLKQGERVGIVADLDALRIRAIAGQGVAAQLIKASKPRVDIRVKGQPDLKVVGRIETIIPSGQERLPSAALGYAAGGATAITMQDPDGRMATEPFFEILVAPEVPEAGRLRPGQIMVLRIETSSKPLLEQGLRALLQLFQKRFQV